MQFYPFKYLSRPFSRLAVPYVTGILLFSILNRLTGIFASLPFVAIYSILLAAGGIYVTAFILISFYRSLFRLPGKRIPIAASLHRMLVLNISSSFLIELIYTGICILSLFIYSDRLWRYLTQFFSLADFYFWSATGLRLSIFLLCTIPFLLLTIVTRLLLWFACMSIGQALQKRRLARTLAIYFLLLLLTNIAKALIAFTCTDLYFTTNTIPTARIILSCYGILYCLKLSESACFYAVSYYLLKKKRNLYEY